MRAWTLATALLLCSVVLAGCADETPTEDATDDEFDGIETEATDTTGVIRGVVVDETITPIADATIRILNTELSTMSTETGAFAFTGLDPGSYFMSISKTGYTDMQQGAMVKAGVDKPDVIKIIMTRDESFKLYFTPYDWKGFIQCGLSVIALCGVDEDVTGDDFITTHVVDAEPDWLQSEMVWDSTQSVSDELWMWHSFSTKDGSYDGSFGWEQGPSPLIIKTYDGEYNQYGDNETWEQMGSTHDLTLRVFSGSISGTRDPSGCYPATPPVPGVIGSLEYCGGVGFTVQQDFRVYTHMFYGFTPGEDWQFSVDGHPVAPEI